MAVMAIDEALIAKDVGVERLQQSISSIFLYTLKANRRGVQSRPIATTR
jgi:hypothetical protein